MHTRLWNHLTLPINTIIRSFLDFLQQREFQKVTILVNLATILDFGRHIGFEENFRVAQKLISNSVVSGS